MNRTRSQLDLYHMRDLSLHKPGMVPYSSQNISPISSNRHKYEIKQKIWPKQTVESWFAKHSFDDRRAVYSFLNTLYADDDNNNHHHHHHVQKEKRSLHRKPPTTRFPNRINSSVANHSFQRQISNTNGHESRASKRDLGEILESLESFRPTSSVQDKAIQTCTTPTIAPLPDVNGRKTPKRSVTSLDKYTEKIQPSDSNTDENKSINRRYLSQTWRVINPREDIEQNVRPENNASSFFNYTKKVYPEYFFIHPDWY